MHLNLKTAVERTTSSHCFAPLSRDSTAFYTFKKWGIFFILLVLGGCWGTDHPQFEGYVEGENIYLASPFYGVLHKLIVHRGQLVHQGMPLFELDPNPQLMHIAQAKWELEQARNTLNDLERPRRTPEIEAIQAQIEQTNAEIALAEVRVSRFQKLYAKQATDKDTLDAAVARLKQQQDLKLQYESNLALARMGSRDFQIQAQKSQVHALEEKLKEAEWDLRQKSIAAPASGVIFDTYYRQGEYVAAQQSVLSLLTPENVYIEFFVPLYYLNRLQVGQKIHFDCAGCAKNNPAVIHYISPDAEYLPPLVYSRDNSSKLVFRIKAHLENPLSFKPGQPVTVTL